MDATKGSGPEEKVRREGDIQTYYHSGAVGDVIYALPALRSHAATRGGKIALVLTNATDVSPSPKLTLKSATSLIKLIAAQPYVASASYEPQITHPPPYNVDAFRKHALTERWARCRFTISDAVATAVGVDWSASMHPWLKCGAKRHWMKNGTLIKVIANRTERFQNPHFPWRSVVEKYSGEIAFAGTDDEYAAFIAKFGCIPRILCDDALQLAEAINGAKLFIGNQSLARAIAEGLKKPIVQECWPQLPNCIWERPDAINYIDGELRLPDVDIL